ncbi:MAG: glutaredoxin [Oscillospiraceae bacterium]|nr:glutaredoxin [Oscillospiraceae bacterium]MBQ3049784.1 glutaredoxin [Oscillospiraceae bacterium]MBQ9938734.1 glutaredoxin [Oscillospiraceae bacterium]
MSKLLMFKLANCPYCKRALTFMNELIKSDPKYAAIEIEMIDEREQPKLAESYDYYYVPTYYKVDGEKCEKLHEGAASKEDVARVLESCLKEQ